MTRLVIVFVLAFLAEFASICYADYPFTPNDTWSVQVMASNGGVTQGAATFGTKTGGNDGYAQGEDNCYGAQISGAGEIISTDLPPNYYYPDGRWKQDLRAPIAKFQVKIWDLKAYIIGASSGTLTLSAWVSSSGVITSPDFSVMLYEGAVNSSSYINATPLFTFPHDTSGSSTIPQYTGTFNFNGNKLFTLVARAVPEPGSVIVLLSGISGLAAILRRRC